MVKILLGNLTSKIVGFLPDNVQDELNDTLSYRLKDAHYMKSVKMKKWDGVYRLYKRSYGQSFYTGLLSLTEEVLKKNNIEYQRIDERVKPEQNLPNLKFIPTEFYEERDYQKFTIERAIQSTRGILKMATGAGKTVVATRIISEIKSGPFMFYTLTRDLMKQAHRELSSYLNEPIGMIGGGEFDIKNINICMVQTAIMAVNLNNKEFKISDYKFDDEDIEWDEEQIDSAERLQTLRELIIRTKGFIVDECHHTSCKSIKDIIASSPNAYWKYGLSVGPESFIETKGGCFERGFVGTIEQAFEIASKTSKAYNWQEFQVIDFNGVSSRGWNGKEFVWKNCKRILRHAGKPCVNIKAQGSNIVVTPDHSIYYATNFNNPQIECTTSAMLKKDDILLGDDGNNYEFSNSQTINMLDFCLKYMSGSRVTVHCDVQKIDRKDLKDIGGTSKTIYNWRKRGGIPIKLFSKLNKLPEIKYLTAEGSSSKISPFINLEDWAYILGFYLGDGWVTSDNRIGFAVNLDQEDEILNRLQNMPYITWNIKKRKMMGKSVEFRINNVFVINILLSIFGRVKCNSKFIPGDWIINWSINNKKELLKGILDSNGYINHRTRNRLTYSTCTTSQQMSKGICSLLRSIGLWGSMNITSPSLGGIINGRQIVGKYEKYTISWTEYRIGFNRSGEYNNRFNHKNIQFVEAPIREISESNTPKWVYDLEMSGHPSFVADGILVHNSATPFREDGAEIMIQAMFGKKIIDISASYLIKNKFLIEPYIIFDPIQNNTKLNAYQSIYKTCIVSNDSFNTHVADIANHLIANGMSVLVLVQFYPQGEFLKKLIPNTEFLTGKMKGEKRELAIKELKERKRSCLIATSLADEGLDVPTLDAVLLAGGGASSTRVHQRIGRTLRIDKKSANPRDRSIVIYFEHHGAKYLDKHAKKARRIIKTEPAFHIIDSAGPQYIKQEIDQIMGDKNDKEKPLSL